MQTCGFTHRTTRHIAVQIVLKVEQASNCAHGNGIKSCGPDKRVTQSILLEILVTRVRKKGVSILELQRLVQQNHLVHHCIKI